MRALAALGLVLLVAGCLEDEPVPEPAAKPEEACDARGLSDLSCGAFCELNPAVCGLPVPTPDPYPVFPVPTPALPTPPGGMPALNGTAPPAVPTMPPVCALVPTLEACPQL